jgi:hypothetical protein
VTKPKRTIFIIIDEVSMVKSDMLYHLDLKLQELKERVGVPFGGVAILDQRITQTSRKFTFTLFQQERPAQDKISELIRRG